MTEKEQPTSDEAVGFGYSGEESVSAAEVEETEIIQHQTPDPEVAPWFPEWRVINRLEPGQMIAPDERLPMGQS